MVQFCWGVELKILVHVPGPKSGLFWSKVVSHLVESRDPYCLEAEVVDNVFQWDVLTDV